MSTNGSATYALSVELMFHQGAIRSIGVLDNGMIVTGAMDSTVCLWIRDDSNHTYTPLVDAAIYNHEHWVTALIPFATGVLPNCPHGGFITGSMDKRIRIFNADGALQSELHGHEGGVISLVLTTSNRRLLSGSWDGTAHVWDLTTLECLHVLPDHENGVCVLGLPDGSIVTGSTGRQVGNTVVDFQLRFWSKEGQLLKTLRDHTGPIRQLAIVPGIGFVSCSNDGSIRVRTMDGQVIAHMTHPLNAEGKPGFVLGVAVLPTSHHIVSASEDGTARVWTVEGTLVQKIEHPSGLWCVASTPNGDFITGCDDKVARVFSSDPTQASESALASFTQAVQEARLVRARGPNGVDIEKLPDYNQRIQVKGKSDGQIQMFRKGTIAIACQWSGPSQTWIDIGEVTGTGSGGVVDGKAYDMVIPVEIEQPGGLCRLEIGYNQGDNPFMVAQEFVNKHMLEQSYLREIADFITKQSGAYQAPVLGSGNDVSGEVSIESIAPQYTYFPVSGYNTFETTKIAKLMTTVRQFNTDNIPESLKLSDAELEHLDAVATTVQQTAYYHSSVFTAVQIGVLKAAVGRWPMDHVFPLLDLLRLVVIHPQGPTAIGGGLGLESIVVRMIEVGASVSSETPMATRMLALRVLANMFYIDTAREAVIAKRSQVMAALSTFAMYRKKTVALSLATLLLNLSRLSMENKTLMSEEEVIMIGSVAMDLLIGSQSLAELGEDTVLRAFVVVGTLVVTHTTTQVKDAMASLLTVFTSAKAQEIKTPAIQSCLEELTRVTEIAC